MTVAEAGNMAKAAERLAISRPVVSKAIAALERTLDIPLFDRSPQGVEPTPYGRALVKRGVAVSAVGQRVNVRVAGDQAHRRNLTSDR